MLNVATINFIYSLNYAITSIISCMLKRKKFITQKYLRYTVKIIMKEGT